MPTLLDLAGLPPAEGLEGQSLAALDGDDRTLQAVVEGDLHLIQSETGVKIFNVVDDPLERHDLAAERPGDVERLLVRLRHFEALGSESTAAPSDIEIGPKALEELRELGYVE